MATLRMGAFTRSLRGKAGNTVFAETKLGTVARDRTFPTGDASPAQVAVRNNMRKDGAAWQALSDAQAQNWNAYAATLTKKGRKSGKAYTPSGYQIFTALGTKFLQLNPGSAVPQTPPTSAFAGDGFAVAATVGTGIVTWTAGGENATGVKTELLLQPLKGKHRQPGETGYVSKAFAAFVNGSLSYSVAVPVGHYAAAYRFVKLATGQETAIVPIGTVTVALALEDGGTVEAAGSAARKKAA